MLTSPLFVSGFLGSDTALATTPWTCLTVPRSAAGWWSTRRCLCIRSERLLASSARGLVRRETWVQRSLPRSPAFAGGIW